MADRPGKYEPGWGDLSGPGDKTQPYSGAIRGAAARCSGARSTTAASPGGRFGAMGMVDYFRLPKRQWYWYRNEYMHIPPPAWPGERRSRRAETDGRQNHVEIRGRHGRCADHRHGRGRGRQGDQQLSAGDAGDRIRPGRISDRPVHHVCRRIRTSPFATARRRWNFVLITPAKPSSAPPRPD